MLDYNLLQKGKFLLAGPCVLESLDMGRKVAEHLVNNSPCPVIFKASFEKANRTSSDSYQGPGLEVGLTNLQKIKQEFGLPIVTDIHLPEQAKIVSEVADILQIPAFLSRQTALLEAAAATGKIVNIKKAQFMAAEDMQGAIGKCEGNQKILLTERGTSFGYHNLVVDFRSFIKMKALGYPVVYDVTHSMQEPSSGKTSGGTPQYALPLARAALATGAVSGLFVEVHPKPNTALCDASTMLDFDKLDELFEIIKKYQNQEIEERV